MGFSLLKAIGGAVTGFVAGGPAGAIIGGTTAGFGAAKHQVFADSTRPYVGQIPDSVVTKRTQLPFFDQSRTTQYFANPNAPGISNYPVNPTPSQPAYDSGSGLPAGCPTGFRLNKSTYVTRGGGTSRWPAGLQVHLKRTTCVRRRKLNAGNGRAATHAVHRLVAFYRLSNRVAKQLRKAASRAHIRGARRGQRALPRGGVEVVNVD